MLLPSSEIRRIITHQYKYEIKVGLRLLVAQRLKRSYLDAVRIASVLGSLL